MPPRTDGRKLVALAASATVAAVGVGTIYLPFMADRDKLRGLFEEGEQTIPEGARREIQAIMKAEAAEQQRQQEIQKQQDDLQQQSKPKASAGSMWSSFRRSS
jgi:Tfp pilus assembly protein PilN